MPILADLIHYKHRFFLLLNASYGIFVLIYLMWLTPNFLQHFSLADFGGEIIHLLMAYVIFLVPTLFTLLIMTLHEKIFYISWLLFFLLVKATLIVLLTITIYIDLYVLGNTNYYYIIVGASEFKVWIVYIIAFIFEAIFRYKFKEKATL